MLPLFTMNTISKPIESDQNANGKQGTGARGGLTKSFSLQLIMHCINSLLLACGWVISGFNMYSSLLSEQRKEHSSVTGK